MFLKLVYLELFLLHLFVVDVDDLNLSHFCFFRLLLELCGHLFSFFVEVRLEVVEQVVVFLRHLEQLYLEVIDLLRVVVLDHF